MSKALRDAQERIERLTREVGDMLVVAGRDCDDFHAEGSHQLNVLLDMKATEEGGAFEKTQLCRTLARYLVLRLLYVDEITLDWATPDDEIRRQP